MLILFTGKGGVGKSTISATTAVHHASQGKKTILVSSDPAHSTDDVIGQKIGFAPTEIGENLWGLNINAEKQAKDLINEKINDSISKLGENIKLRRFFKLDKTNYTFGYSHNNKIVSLVELKNSDESLAKDICMQIVASNPVAIDEASLDKDLLKSEKDIYKQELDKLDKKEDIKRNILEGKMKKFVNENTLLNQPFVKDPSTSLSKIIKDNEVLSYNRYEVGEGLEKKSEDFAQEVYNQIS